MTELLSIPLNLIRLNDYNPNSMDAETFNALLSGMKDGGPESIDPILLRPLEEATGADAEAVSDAEPAYEVVDGEHRIRSALLLGWTEIRARVQNLSLEEAMVVNYRKNRERGRLDPFKEGRLYKWWRDEKELTMRQIGEKFVVDFGVVSRRIKNVDTVDEEAIAVLKGQIVSTEAVVVPGQHQPELKEKVGETKKTAHKKRVPAPEREEPIEAKKLDLLGSITLPRLLKRSRFLMGLDEDIPEDAKLMEELREKYREKIKNLQVAVAKEIRKMSRREAETHTEKRWADLLIEASNERRARELLTKKATLEKSGKTVILREEKDWTQRDRLTDRGKVLPKCLNNCPQPTTLLTRSGKTEEICGYGACWAETKEAFEAEKAREAEEETQKLMEAREKIIKSGEAGDQYWIKLLLFLVSLNPDTRPGYLDKYNLVNRWKPIVGMTEGQAFGKLLTLVAERLCRPRREDDEVDFLQVLNAISKYYDIDKDYLLWEPEALVDVELEVAP